MRVQNDIKRWTSRQEKRKQKAKYHVYDVMTKHALQRAKERDVKVRDILQGRARVEQILTEDMRFITIIPITRKS